ncbi:MAG TPA: DUF2383 domain-containing protein [Longimicrobium sp.]|nr:DUF2383 domain-containing protein [Longimicrobium sp.]
MDTDTTRLDPPATAEILEGLNDLLQLDHDAVGAYEIAMEKLRDRDHADQVAGFRRDHERHIRELNELIAELGGTPSNQPHVTGPFKLALQSLGGLAGDRGTLMAFRANELQVRAKYDAYAAKANAWPTNIKRIIDAAALDEERHFRWVNDVLGTDENAVLDRVDAARERAEAHARPVDRVTDTVEGARARAADLAGTVRDRVTSGADAVRNRLHDVLNRDGAGISGAALAGEAYDGVPAGTRADRLAAVRDRMDTLAGDAGTGVRERVQTRPLQTLLIAGIAGFVIGRLLR